MLALIIHFFVFRVKITNLSEIYFTYLVWILLEFLQLNKRFEDKNCKKIYLLDLLWP